MIFHWSLCENLSPQVSRTLLSILTDFNNAVVWMVSTRPVISRTSSPCINFFVSVPRAPITIGITVTFIFHSFQSPSNVEVFIFFIAFFQFYAVFSFFFLLLIIIKSSNNFHSIKDSKFISKDSSTA